MDRVSDAHDGVHNRLVYSELISELISDINSDLDRGLDSDLNRFDVRHIIGIYDRHIQYGHLDGHFDCFDDRSFHCHLYHQFIGDYIRLELGDYICHQHGYDRDGRAAHLRVQR